MALPTVVYSVTTTTTTTTIPNQHSSSPDGIWIRNREPLRPLSISPIPCPLQQMSVTRDNHPSPYFPPHIAFGAPDGAAALPTRLLVQRDGMCVINLRTCWYVLLRPMEVMHATADKVKQKRSAARGSPPTRVCTAETNKKSNIII